MEYKGFQLDPFQEQAIRAISEGRSVIVAAPTGAGKTLIAEYALEQCLREGKRLIYTAPIKALSNQKFRDFGRAYGGKIGILTGDVSLNPDAPVLIMTTEIFRNTIFENPERLAGLSHVIFDEIHFLDDPERGTVWEESIIFAPADIRFVFLSATISNLDELSAWISEVRHAPLEVVLEEGRPVPLHHRLFIAGRGIGDWKDFRAAADEAERRGRREPRGRRSPFARPRDDRGPDVVRTLAARGDLPAIVFSFRRADCEEKAERTARLDLVSPEQGKALAADFDALARTFDIGDDPGAADMRRLVAQGVAFHHAGLLPTLKEVVERLFTDGRIRLLFATDTFALGVNMPAKAVVLSALRKFDGERISWLLSREYQQMAGRAGRRGIDTEGSVYAVVDPENDRLEGARRVVTGRPEEVNSRFSLSYAALLALFGRLGEENLFRACEQSFAAFRRRLRGGGEAFRHMMAQVHARLEFLRRIGYIHDGSVSPLGRRAAVLYGYELQVAELYRAGVFHALDAPRLAALFAALVFEEKPMQQYRYLPRRMWGPIHKRVRGTVAGLRAGERRSGVRDLLKEPGFGIAAAAHAWAMGAEFRELEKWISASDGDIVRSFRMANQLLRQAERAFPDDDHLLGLLRDARRRMNRDVVDAEKQLRQGAGLAEAEDEALEGEKGREGEGGGR